jgi:hypothetical protein
MRNCINSERLTKIEKELGQHLSERALAAISNLQASFRGERNQKDLVTDFVALDSVWKEIHQTAKGLGVQV